MARIAVIGAGWAGLSAALALQARGHALEVFEMAAAPGGRARSLAPAAQPPVPEPLDNGQHILIGAYTQTLGLMRSLGLDADALLWRSPLRLLDAQGRGLRLPAGPPLLAFARAVLGARHWPRAARFSLLRHSLAWATGGFRCPATHTVQTLCQGLHEQPYRELVAPLCVAALNTPAGQASAQVFLRVLKDALFAGKGSADLLLPRRPLQDLLPAPAWSTLARRGARLHSGCRAQVQPDGRGWRVEGQSFDAVLLACPAAEAARQLQPIAAGWAQLAQALRYEPIVTVYLEAQGQLPFPMVALQEHAQAPAQYLFDHGLLGLTPGRFAAVVSGARSWLEAGDDALAACTNAVLQQITEQVPQLSQARPLRTLAEKRATFACTPGLTRPPARVARGLWAAGDYIEGPYPATLEGAVRAGQAAATGLLAELGQPLP